MTPKALRKELIHLATEMLKDPDCKVSWERVMRQGEPLNNTETFVATNRFIIEFRQDDKSLMLSAFINRTTSFKVVHKKR